LTTLSIEQPNYFRAALSNQYNLILLAGSVAFAAAFSSWAPLFSGLVGEALWLVAGPSLPAFRRRIDTVRQEADGARALGALLPEYAERVQAVEREVVEIQGLVASRPGVPSDEQVDVARRLKPVVQAFMEVCTTHQRLRRMSAPGQLGELHSELSSLHQALANETDLGMRASVRRALTVAERRIKQHEGNEAACRSMELGMQTLQKSLIYLKECAAGLGTMSDLCAEIDGVVAQLSRIAALEVERESEQLVGRTTTSIPTLN
jgi:hypothetical protein